MEKIEWRNLSNAEIKLKQLTLKETYEKTKIETLKLLDILDALDYEYDRGLQELNKRKNMKNND
jgi:hypothetical protein